jgi:hypothetical protein
MNHDVVGVFWPFVGDLTMEHDSFRFLEGEFGAFDEVREVRLVERQRGPSVGVVGEFDDSRARGTITQTCSELGEQLEARRVVAVAGRGRRETFVGDDPGVAGLQRRCDQRVQGLGGRAGTQVATDLTGQIADRVQPARSACCAQLVDPFLGLVTRQAAPTGALQPFKQGSCLRRDKDSIRRLVVTLQRARARVRRDRHTRQLQRSVAAMHHIQHVADRQATGAGRAVRDHGAR